MDRATLAVRSRIVRRARMLRALVGPSTGSGRYRLKDDYVERALPNYDSAANWGDVLWQPDVYPAAAQLAREVGASLIVDVGCGNGAKLMSLRPEFETIGLDHGGNLDVCRGRYPDATWVEHDFETEGPLPVDTAGAVLVCADVIEHLVRPENLVAKLRMALETGRGLVLSTPERDLTWGISHSGPPPNPAHTREWSRRELRAFLKGEGIDARVTLTRSRDNLPLRNTIMAVAVSPASASDKSH